MRSDTMEYVTDEPAAHAALVRLDAVSSFVRQQDQAL